MDGVGVCDCLIWPGLLATERFRSWLLSGCFERLLDFFDALAILGLFSEMWLDFLDCICGGGVASFYFSALATFFFAFSSSIR